MVQCHLRSIACWHGIGSHVISEYSDHRGTKTTSEDFKVCKAKALFQSSLSRLPFSEHPKYMSSEQKRYFHCLFTCKYCVRFTLQSICISSYCNDDEVSWPFICLFNNPRKDSLMRKARPSYGPMASVSLPILIFTIQINEHGTFSTFIKQPVVWAVLKYERLLNQDIIFARWLLLRWQLIWWWNTLSAFAKWT